jgi:hypothetical protein
VSICPKVIVYKEKKKQTKFLLLKRFFLLKQKKEQKENKRKVSSRDTVMHLFTFFVTIFVSRLVSLNEI